METIKIPTGASGEARICLTCTEKQCVKDALKCKRFKTEMKKQGIKHKNNKVTRRVRQ